MLTTLINKFRFLAIIFEALTISLNPFTKTDFSLRWRLIPLQLLNCLLIPIKVLPYVFSNTYKTIWIPTRSGHELRALVFTSNHSVKPKLDEAKKSPLHINFHGGAFIGGIAEIDAWFCQRICEQTGAVVISAEYRHAPMYVYPAAHEDAEDVVDYCIANAERLWRADGDNMTVSGGSAGGSLMFVAGQRAKLAIGICPVLDFRIPPWEKRKPAGFPKIDPLSFLMPLFDAYAGPIRSTTRDDAKLNPILKPIDELPRKILLITAGIDVLFDEQKEFFERVRGEVEIEAKGRKIEQVVFEKGFHGWLELPKGVIVEEDRRRAWGAAVEAIAEAHGKSS